MPIDSDSYVLSPDVQATIERRSIEELRRLADEYAARNSESVLAYQTLREAKEAVTRAREAMKRAEQGVRRAYDAYNSEAATVKKRFPGRDIPPLPSIITN